MPPLLGQRFRTLTKPQAPEFKLNARRFGVEIEACLRDDRYELGETLDDLGLRTTRHRQYDGWDPGDDMSIHPGPSVELRSPPLQGEDALRELTIATRGLAKHGAYVNRTCGLHVHHECKDLTPSSIVRLVKNYRRSQSAIDGLVSPTRVGNSYCGRIPKNWAEDLEAACSQSKTQFDRQCAYWPRYAISLNPLADYRRTIEFRQHHGSVNAEEIAAWVAFGQAMISAAAADASIAVASTSLLVDALQEHGLDPAAAASLKQRESGRMAA